ncbi:MAG TPA: transporter substrate-binding domain-containing protein [Myxococcota bacterium]|nr:transporter substrate-binding domain-containing protein [Myxococcota bacterium]
MTVMPMDGKSRIAPCLMAFAMASVLSVMVVHPASARAPSAIVYGADEDFPPFEWVAPDGTLQGFNIDLMRGISSITGMTIQFVPGPWSEIRQKQWEGSIDVISMFKSQDREAALAFSDPLTVGYDTIWIRKGEDDVKNLDQLAGKGVLVQQTGFAAEFLSGSIPSARLIFVESEPQALVALENGRGDVAIVSELTARTAIGKLGLKAIRKTGPPILPRHLAFATTFDKTPVLDELNAAMAMMRADGRYSELEAAWLEAPAISGPVQEFLKKYGRLTLLIILGLVTWLAAWTIILRRRVAARTKALQGELQERRRAEEELRRSQEVFDVLFNFNPVMMSLSSLNEGRYLEVNPAAVKLLGFSRLEMIGRTSSELNLWVDPGDRTKIVRQVLENGHCRNYPLSIRERAGRHIECILNMEKVVIRGEDVVLTTIHDVSNLRSAEREKARLESQLRQIQKIEMAGRLAGGVAHDFNNQLTIIRGYCDVLSRRLSSAADISVLEEIRKAVNHSSSLTSSLLAFSRRQVRRLEILDPGTLIREMEQSLRVSLGENLNLDIAISDTVDRIEMDRGQFVEVIYNIVANARDAMGTGGTLAISVNGMSVNDSLNVGGVPVACGDYVVITLADDGIGMSDDTMKLLFEPFFTTKEVGKGIGLGLSTVYGIIKQNSGYIDITSTVGQGTTVTLFIPALSRTDGAAGIAPKDGTASGGNETVLLAEDEKGLFMLLSDVLKDAGYRVMAADRPLRALELAQETRPDILVTDVVMPEMSGKELAARIKQIHPNLKVLYMSGYPRDTISAHGILSSDVDLLNKPFSLEEFQRTVRQVLDS